MTQVNLVSVAWRRKAGLILLLVAIALPLAGQQPETARTPHYLPIEVDAAGWPRSDKVVEAAIDLAPERARPLLADPAALQPLRLHEVDSGGRILDSDVPFQFDRHPGADARSKTSGTLVFVMRGETPANATRRYRLHLGPAPRTAVVQTATPAVKLDDIGDYEGEAAWKITTPSASYYYHRQSGGFASLVDRGGNDWISYRPGNKAQGEYRGIPNIAPPDFHPGRPQSKKPGRIVFQGPLRVRLLAETEDGEWGTHWDIFPHTARLTLFKKGDEPYWILYEGTPGGEFTVTDYWVNSAGRRFDSAPYDGRNRWNGDLPAPEWVYFGDTGLDRVLFFARHEYSPAVDEYWHFGDGGMTVFGFGRGPRQQGWQRLTEAPSHLTIGFVESARHRDAANMIESAWRDVRVRVGAAVTAR